MAIIYFLWQLYCFNLDNGHLKAKNHVADKNLLFSVKIEKIKGGLGFPLCKFCKKKSARLQLRKWRWGVNWQCGTEDVGGDQLGGRPLEHKDDADTGVARGGNRYQFKHFGRKSIELDPTDSCMLRSTRCRDGYCLRKKLDVLDRSTFQKANCMQLGVEMFW